MWNSSLDFPISPNRKNVWLGPALGGKIPFGLGPKLSLEIKGLGSIFMVDCLFIMQITLFVNSMDPEQELCR